MAVTTTKTNKPINPRGNDQSPKGYNRAALYSGKALDFDGVNDEVNCGDFMTDNADFSVSFYVKINTWANNKGVISTWDNSYNGFAIALHSTGLKSWANDGASSGMVIVTQEELGTTEYHHIVLTYDYSTGTQKGYFNGHYTNQQVFVDTMTHSDFQIGYGNFGYTYSDVNVAGVKVFNEVLTAAQVADLYNNPEKIVPTGVEDTALKLWLPMMEGAGTTAYDGSGNGNHGTISGATYVNGVGAPVAQSAVIDWNKAKNDAGRSQEFDNAYWGKGGLIVTANATTAPDGTQTADKLAAISTANSNAEIYRAIGFTANNAASVFVKSDTAQWVTLGTNRTLGRVVFFDIINGVVGTESTGYTGAITEYLNGWYKLDVYWDGTATTQTYWDLSIADADNAFGVTAGKSIFAWGAYANLSDTTIGPYIATLTDSAITSPVLLPQGLTSGRDITGVNLFENVRKQGALNLDGNSWAEVHDNASLDITDAVSLEMWIYWEDQSAETTILGKWVGGADRAYALIATTTTGRVDFRQRVSSTTYTMGISTLSNGWNHLVATHDHSANERLGYINGVLVSTATSQGVSNESDNNITIGGISTTQYTNNIAQPRIYNRALTAEEVQRNYDAGKNTYTNS